MRTRSCSRPERNFRGHHVIVNWELRGGGVKARRPRASAVEAKRRALHAAEHSASIECVMANARADLSARDHFARAAQNKIFPETLPHHSRARQTAGRRSSSGRLQLADCDEDRWQHGVSAPVRPAAGRDLTPAAGSLTPWSLLRLRLPGAAKSAARIRQCARVAVEHPHCQSLEP